MESWLTPLDFGILSLGKAQLLLEFWSGWVLKASSPVPVVTCCPAMHSQYHSWESCSCQTDIHDVYEQLLWRIGLSSRLHHTESFISFRFKTEGPFRSIFLYSSMSLHITRFKKYTFNNNDSWVLPPCMSFLQTACSFRSKFSVPNRAFLSSCSCGSDWRLKGIIKQVQQSNFVAAEAP